MSRDSRSPLISAQQSQLVVIDVQEKLLPTIYDQHNVAAAIRFLMDAAAILEVCVTVTEQYPRGLGPTVEQLRNHSSPIRTLEKLQFSAAETLMTDAWASEASKKDIPGRSPTQIVLAGIETHVCVQQTALELTNNGFQVFVAADCVGSRFPDDHHWGLHRMANAGVIITTGEAIAFEWCERAGHDRFKALSRMIRDRDLQRKV
jgi:nicotinamidase-related amidase